MGLDKLSPSRLGFYAPRFEVEINNKRLTADLSKTIVDVTVEEKMDEGASFTFTVHDAFDLKKQKFTWLDHPLFALGNTVGIRMGYGGDVQEMILGKISKLEPSFFAGELPTITVSGQDLSYDHLKRASKERAFLNKAYSAIAQEIATEAKLQAVVDATAISESLIRKNNHETYFSFLESLARKVGYTFRIDRRTLYFIKPKDDTQEILTLELGKDIISFRPQLSSANIVTEVEVRGHSWRDPKTAIIGRARAGSERGQEPGRKPASQVIEDRTGPVKLVITGVIVDSVEQADARARAELNRRNDGFIQGEVESIGLPQIRPGLTIKLAKMGQRFSGKYYVKDTRHSIDSNGYRLNFTVKRNAL